ncbi:hypothetical protein BD311DRAFT_743655 [Dichomitus squalens]|uniref:Peptidase C14 caspase domain-containing protein n=1 Tax=Dichomitus squalens TaxID=114155 RepID=A0A4Q9M3B8_9APHY|nr:hypothetical protein BD311DRAFT_743655 [Dichomitus squalens]
MRGIGATSSCLNDVVCMFLAARCTEIYGYLDSEITLMLDDEGTSNLLLPTRENLIREIEALMAVARPGDKFMFYYSGHGHQLPCGSKEEEDGLKEAIIPFDPDDNAEPILDDDLRHYLCNKGVRDFRFLTQARVVRRDGSGFDADRKPSVRIYERKQSKEDRIVRRNTLIIDGDRHCSDSDSKLERLFRRSTTALLPRHGLLFVEQRQALRGLSLHNFSPQKSEGKGLLTTQLYDEPESEWPCDGLCKSKCESQKANAAHVISVSACQDPQQTWESQNGTTMTQSIIGYLQSQNGGPHPPLLKLIAHVGHELHKSTTLKLHRYCQKNLDKWRKQGSPQDNVPNIDVANGSNSQVTSSIRSKLGNGLIRFPVVVAWQPQNLGMYPIAVSSLKGDELFDH